MVCEVEGVEVDWRLGLTVSDVCWSLGKGFKSLQYLCLLFFRCLWFLRVFREAVSVALLHITSYSVGATVVLLSCGGVVCCLWLTPSPGGPVPRMSSASCLLFPGEVEGFVREEPLQVG